MQARQANIAQLNEVYREMAIQSRRANANVPEPIQTKMEMLNSDSIKVRQMASNLKPVIRPSHTETLVEGTIYLVYLFYNNPNKMVIV